MTLKHRCLLTSGFAILSVVAVLGGASAQSSTSSNARTQGRPPESKCSTASRCMTTTIR